MKANELMVDDLVIANYKTDEQVYAKIGHLYPCYGDLEHDSIGFIPCASIGHLEQYINDERGINPIPLTEDILKANGFEKIGGYYIHRIDENPNHYDFKLEIGGALRREGFSLHCGIYILTIKYVHQLQHILRDCGLDDLADNFKVV